MSDVETAAPAPDEAQALSAARAGYAKATGATPPAPEASAPQGTAASGDDSSAGANGAPATTQASTEKPDTTASTAAPAAPAAAPAAINDELASLKQHVKDLQATGGASAQEVRRLHGEIGTLTKAIRSFEQAKGTAADDQLTAALKRAERMAEEYPEIAGPMVEALKLMHQKQAAPPAVEAPAPAAPSQPQAAPEQQAAIRAIDEAHPDRHQVTASDGFKAWFAAQTPAYQSMVQTTWNPAVLSDCLTKFKTHDAVEKARVAAKAAEDQRKKDRLTAAASPQGVPGKGQPTTLPDEEGFRRGYAKRKHF
jgi:hypothetical protein